MHDVGKNEDSPFPPLWLQVTVPVGLLPVTVAVQVVVPPCPLLVTAPHDTDVVEVVSPPSMIATLVVTAGTMVKVAVPVPTAMAEADAE